MVGVEARELAVNSAVVPGKETGASPLAKKLPAPAVVRFFIVLFLISPFLFLIFHFYKWSRLDFGELVWAFKNSFLQSFFSATACVLLGTLGATGVLFMSATETRRYWRSLIEILLLIPNFLPTLFTLIACLNVFDPFPMGKIGIVLVHTFLNWGLVAVLMAQLFESKLADAAEWALVSGCGKWRFFIQLAWPMVRRDILLIWVFVFAICFESFSIPLVVGGGSGTTMEVLIYEKIRLSTDWSQALLVALVQSLAVALVGWFAIRGTLASPSRARGGERNLTLLQTRWGVLVILGMIAIFLLGYVRGLPLGFQQLSDLWELKGILLSAVIGSYAIGVTAGVFVFALLMAVAFAVPSAGFEKFLSSYSAPSQALTAFVMVVILPNTGAWSYLKIPLALGLLLLCTLWRMGWRSQVDGLARQHETAEILGASPWLRFVHVTLPQTAPAAGRLAGIAALWAVGDFAVSRIVAHHDLSLAMVTETLMSGYRLGLATVLTLGVLFVGGSCFFFMRGIGNVIGRKSFLVQRGL